MLEHLHDLPEETRQVVRQHLELLESTEKQKKVTEQRLQTIVQQRDDVDLLRTLPGVGWILATVLAFEIGDIQRFDQAPELASYAGTVPRVYSSGGKTRYGRVHPDVNRYLKWALVEAGNLIVMRQQRLGDIHAVRLYARLRVSQRSCKGRYSRRPASSESGLLGFKTKTALQRTAGLSRFVHAPVSARISHESLRLEA